MHIKRLYQMRVLIMCCIAQATFLGAMNLKDKDEPVLDFKKFKESFFETKKKENKNYDKQTKHINTFLSKKTDAEKLYYLNSDSSVVEALSARKEIYKDFVKKIELFNNNVASAEIEDKKSLINDFDAWITYKNEIMPLLDIKTIGEKVDAAAIASIEKALPKMSYMHKQELVTTLWAYQQSDEFTSVKTKKSDDENAQFCGYDKDYLCLSKKERINKIYDTVMQDIVKKNSDLKEIINIVDAPETVWVNKLNKKKCDSLEGTLNDMLSVLEKDNDTKNKYVQQIHQIKRLKDYVEYQKNSAHKLDDGEMLFDKEKNYTSKIDSSIVYNPDKGTDDKEPDHIYNLRNLAASEGDYGTANILKKIDDDYKNRYADKPRKLSTQEKNHYSEQTVNVLISKADDEWESIVDAHKYSNQLYNLHGYTFNPTDPQLHEKMSWIDGTVDHMKREGAKFLTPKGMITHPTFIWALLYTAEKNGFNDWLAGELDGVVTEESVQNFMEIWQRSAAKTALTYHGSHLMPSHKNKGAGDYVLTHTVLAPVMHGMTDYLFGNVVEQKVKSGVNWLLPDASKKKKRFITKVGTEVLLSLPGSMATVCWLYPHDHANVAAALHHQHKGMEQYISES